MPDEPTPAAGEAATPEPGSPEDVSARLAAFEAESGNAADPEAASGVGEEPKPQDGAEGQAQDTKSEGQEPEAVSLSKEEHDKLFGELRLLRKEKRDREKAEADARRSAEQKKAEADGDYQKAAELERAEKIAAQDRARKLGVKLALAEASQDRGWTASQRSLAKKLVDFSSLDFDDEGEPSPESLSEALDSIVSEYPEAFSVAKDGDDEKDTRGSRRAARKTPATLPQDSRPFEGYLTPEEYQSTPFEVRLTPEFQKRVALSQPHWPDKVPHNAFPGGSGERYA